VQSGKFTDDKLRQTESDYDKFSDHKYQSYPHDAQCEGQREREP